MITKFIVYFYFIWIFLCMNRSFGKAHAIPQETPATDKAKETVVFGPEQVENMRKKYGYHPFPFTGGLDKDTPK